MRPAPREASTDGRLAAAANGARSTLIGLAAGVLLTLSGGGCATPPKMNLVEFSTGEKAEGFVDTGKKEMRVYLADGDILTGPYRIATNPRFTIGTGVSTGTYGTRFGLHPYVGVDGRAKLYALLTSHRTKIALEVIADHNRFSGSGFGEARANDGRVFKVIF